jgi:hypothetical protein
VSCQRGLAQRCCKWVSTTHFQPVRGEVSRAGDEFFFARFDLDCRRFLADEFDGHFDVLGVGELSELSQ